MACTECSLNFGKVFDELFKCNSISCRKLYYDGIYYYCSKDVLKRLLYSTNPEDVKKILDKLADRDKFTIKELLIKHRIVCDDEDDNKPLIDYLKKNDKNYIFITRNGLKTLLATMTTPIPKNMSNVCDILQINTNRVFLKKEQEILSCLINAFKNENYIIQYSILGFRIYLYFKDYKLAIDPEKTCTYFISENDREALIRKELGCKFIRFNPESRDFNIFELIANIYYYMKFVKINFYY